MPFTVTYTFEPADLISAGRTHALQMIRRAPFLLYIAGLLTLAFVGLSLVVGGDPVDAIIPFLGGALGAGAVLFVLSRYVFIPLAERRQFNQNTGISGEQIAVFDEDTFSLEGSRGKSVHHWHDFYRWAESATHVMFYLTSRMYFVVPKRALNEAQMASIRAAVEKSGLKRL